MREIISVCPSSPITNKGTVNVNAKKSKVKRENFSCNTLKKLFSGAWELPHLCSCERARYYIVT
jgi:hypothetical protein